MTKILAVILIAGPSLTAQEMENYIFKLDNGAQVLYQTYSEISLSNKERAFGTASASGNVIRRTMLDEKRNPWMAFELHIDRKPGPGPIHFLLSMEPLGAWRFFGQKAAPREIENGDRILLDVLEEPDTGRKVFDTFQVGIGVPMNIMPMSRSIPEIPKAATAIHVENPRLTKIGRGAGVPAGNRGTIFGAKVAVCGAGQGPLHFLFPARTRLPNGSDSRRIAPVLCRG